jgi:ABC-type tungstate transport system permease subunit
VVRAAMRNALLLSRYTKATSPEDMVDIDEAVSKKRMGLVDSLISKFEQAMKVRSNVISSRRRIPSSG